MLCKNEISAIVASVLIVLVSAGSVIAACSDDQTIMRLYSLSNSHGAVWNDEHGHNVQICYDEIFGMSFSGEAHPVCDSSNTILWLSDLYNSHASMAADAIYDVPICYGDINCTVRNISCIENEKIVVKLHSEINTHLAAPNYESSGTYEKILCCKQNAVSMANWTNLNGEIIHSANMSDTIRLVLTKSGLQANTPVVFEIYEHDQGFFNGEDYIGNVSGIVDENGNVVAYWKILRGNLSTTPHDYNELYFNVLGYQSDYLSVSELEEDDPMNLIIISPICGSDYNKSSVVGIEINATDSDDIITGNVTIGMNITPFSNGYLAFDYAFNDAGNLQVVVIGTNTRGYMRRLISSIMIVDTTKDGSYVAACIDRPSDFSDIGSGSVKFEAIGSKGLRYSPSTDRQYISTNALNFYWLFSDGRTNPNVDGENSLSYDFWKTFQDAGQNWATLEVEMK